MKKLLFFVLFTFLLSFNIKAQNWWWTLEEMSNMPEPVSNNAVVEGWANDTGYVYSFGGIDNTKIWSGIHLKSFRYNTVTDVWDTIPALPDTLGKIAAAASWVDSIIYIIGGYHVYANSNEVSSAKVHRFDPRTNTYLSDGMDIPVPIDDHVQAVWNDSLIYVITGWSNTGNVPNVQIYDPVNDNWLIGTSTPNNNIYKAFGASGSIVGDTIYYHGGASNSFNFPGQSTLRKGYINPINPTQITWSLIPTNYISYRASSFKDKNEIPHFIGGSNITYNYNGIAYNGSGGVTPNKRALKYINNILDTVFIDTTLGQLPMDLRGVGSFPNHSFYNEGVWFIAGGMEENQTVSNKTIKLIYTLNISTITENKNDFNLILFPNPTSSQINLLFDEIENKTIQLIDLIGNVVLTKQNKSNNIQLDLSTYPKGIYFVKVTSQKGRTTQKIIIQ